MRKITLSHSQKAVYKQCPRKWYRQYLLEEGGPDKSQPLLFGEFTHKLIEESLYGDLTLKKVDEITLTMLANKLNRTPDFIRLTFSDVSLAIKLAYEGLLTLRKDFKGLYHYSEEPFIERDLTIKDFYRGIIDCLYIDKNNKVVLLDWKTTSYPYRHHQVKTSTQLKGYAYLVEELSIKVDYLAYGVLDKRQQTATILKIKNDHNYTVFLNELTKVRGEINYALMLTPITMREGDLSDFFRKDEEACFDYNAQCSFYDKCWEKDTRLVTEILLVNSEQVNILPRLS